MLATERSDTVRCVPQLGHALSEHPLASHAVGEVVGALLEQVGQSPDLAVLFVSADHVAEIDDVVFSIRELLRPGVLIGATGDTVVGGSREVEQRPAISLWAASDVEVEALRLRAVRQPEGMAVVGWPGDELGAVDAAVLLVDPFTFPTEPLLAHLRQEHPDLPVVGGLASAARQPGGNRLVVDGSVLSDGAVGVLIRGGVRTTTVVSQGCRPIGEAFVVTGAEGNVITALAGEPPLRRLEHIAQTLSPDEQELLRRGIHLGLVVDEHKPEFGRGDFLIRNLVGADQEAGSVATDQHVEVGTTVQFQVRDAASADDDLRHLLAGHTALGALLFTCNGRGTHLFDEPDHDASVVTASLDTAQVAGMSCAGEIGPVAGSNHLHGFTASLLLFE